MAKRLPAKMEREIGIPQLSVLNQLILMIEGLRRIGKSIRMVTKTEEVKIRLVDVNGRVTCSFIQKL